jgi:cytochrome P450
MQVGPLSLNLLKGEQHARVKRLLGQAFSEEAVAKVAPALDATAQAFCSRSGSFLFSDFQSRRVGFVSKQDCRHSS